MAQNPKASDESLDPAPRADEALPPVERSIEQLTSLLQDLEPTAGFSQSSHAAYENRLVEVRLGIASSLFTALRHKHSPTAAHSLRVALGCSSWAFALGLEPDQRDELEVAALLHDIGKIGAPDRLLLKPGPLAEDEAQLMDQYRLSGLDILSNCCPSRAIVEIIRHSAGWYDGSRLNYPLLANDIPAGGRILAVVDAFDSMTSDQVYRAAMSRERALHELFSRAGTQFDPDLVKSYSELQITVQLHRKVVGHWLAKLDPRQSNRFWRNLTILAQPAAISEPESLFRQKLLDSMYDAVIFVDRNMQVILWNRGAERLTGISAASVCRRAWSPALIGMRDASIGALDKLECPINYSVTTGVQSLRRLLVANRNNRPVAVDVHTVPVVGPDGITYGAAMLLHDASGEASLEERCQNLHEKATKDPLTQVANRAEFDRTHQLFIGAHQERQLPCSMIMCDIDHFKSVNDTYGHQAGDEVLKSFGQLLRSECRSGDLVARYGGEEFIVLCADCNNAAATRRAEQLRKSMSELPQPALNGEIVTASFGVTEIQPGDSPESMLRRADRAMFEAKQLGRNVVVQLGNGIDEVGGNPRDARPLQPADQDEFLIETVLVTAVPLNIAIEKLRGFLLDHDAEILSIKADRLELQIASGFEKPGRRRTDRCVPFLVELAFLEHRVPATTVDGRAVGQLSRTRVWTAIRVKRARDRKVRNVTLQANSIVAAIKSYLMASEDTQFPDSGTTRRAANMLSPLLKKRE
ncbi:MAG: diguanylate cyclase [Planctomycetia bacterium]|nr:diguanylate cyclase [Planctomycetia bacterium]